MTMNLNTNELELELKFFLELEEPNCKREIAPINQTVGEGFYNRANTKGPTEGKLFGL